MLDKKHPKTSTGVVPTFNPGYLKLVAPALLGALLLAAVLIILPIQAASVHNAQQQKEPQDRLLRDFNPLIDDVEGPNIPAEVKSATEIFRGAI